MRYLRAIERRERPLKRTTIETTDGRTLDGAMLNQGLYDLQLRTDDKRVHLLRRSGTQFRRSPPRPAGRPTTAIPAATATRR